MILQLEGVDGAGKSTLAAAVAKEWRSRDVLNQATIIHTGSPGQWRPDDMSLDMWRRYCFYRLKAVIDTHYQWDSRELLIMDRGSWGSPVYGSIFRPEIDEDGYGDLGEKYFYDFEELLFEAGGVTIVVSPLLEVILNRSVGREDEYLDTVSGDRAEQLIKIYYKYKAFVEENRDRLSTYVAHNQLGVTSAENLVDMMIQVQAVRNVKTVEE